tara:strand:+ start:748 stop:1107 length:360 start_codon:yes stop_codon:yes gene_type:complete
MSKYEIHQEFYYYNEWKTVRIYNDKFETFVEAEAHLLDLGLLPIEDFYQLEGQYLLSHNEYARPTYTIVKVKVQETTIGLLDHTKQDEREITLSELRKLIKNSGPEGVYAVHYDDGGAE